METWIETVTNRRIYFDEEQMKTNYYDIEDIIVGLSNICRFAGQCRSFYSVLQHCLHSEQVAEYLELDYTTRMTVLLHDAVEAYMVDVPRPLKYMLSEYRTIEHRFDEGISKHFNLHWPWPPIVKDIDRGMLATEAKRFGLNTSDDWDVPKPIAWLTIPIMSQHEVRKQFTNRMMYLVNKRREEQLTP